MSAEPWTGRQDQGASEQTENQDQDQDQDQDPHPDKLSLDSFWSEVETIRQGRGYSEQHAARRGSRQSEDGEQEERWLQDAGLSSLLDEGGEDGEGGGANAALMSTLTRTQAATVQRRLDQYTLSLRRKTRPPARGDVRDVFTSSQTALSESGGDTEDTPPQDSMETLSETTVSLEPRRGGGATREEVFMTDVAFCEQAVILLRLAKQHGNLSHRRTQDGTLPRVVCPRCRLGVTRIGDLSAGDMKKVRQLALIDMTALCDLLELDAKRLKTSKRTISESCLFGVPLATLLENDQKVKPSTTPLILQALLSFLEKRGVDSEGILRVPGSQSRIKLLQQNLENHFYSGRVSWDSVSPNDAAALLKKFIRELPSPLLTTEHLSTFSAVRDIPDLKQKLHMLNLLILLLPEANRNTLKALLEFLSKVVSCEKRNRMNMWAVSTIMAPNLFLHKALPSRLPEGGEKAQAEKAADIMRLLIRYQDLLWTIPNFLMSQVRRLNENSARRYQFYDKRIKNLLRKIHTDSRDKPDKNASEPCREVKIQVGGQQSGSMEVHINVSSQASDLLAQFHRQYQLSPAPDNSKGLLRRNGFVPHADCAMYEVGGNIGEHCLDPDTHLLDLYNSNPGGEWIIRLKPSSRGS